MTSDRNVHNPPHSLSSLFKDTELNAQCVEQAHVEMSTLSGKGPHYPELICPKTCRNKKQGLH